MYFILIYFFFFVDNRTILKGFNKLAKNMVEEIEDNL